MATSRRLAQGNGWSVSDVICTSGPADEPFEERHTRVSIAVVLAGTFQYRTTSGSALMTPGSIFLGSAGHCFECGHEHATGDRCVSFNLAPEYFERIAADRGARGNPLVFSVPRLPPLSASAPVVAETSAGLAGADVSWEELGVRVAATVSCVLGDLPTTTRDASSDAIRRVTDVVRAIERLSATELSLERMAAMAGLSPYHFLRTFERVTGVTPHQYVRRARLRDAAVRLRSGDGRVIDAAFDSGFRDLSSFNRAFRAEFGATPRSYRAAIPSR
jgi:AraC family transcriptional regulator